MAEQKEMNLLQFVSLTIENCLGCEKEHLTFSYMNNVHLLLYNLDKPNNVGPSPPIIVTPVGRALQLMSTLEYSTRDSLRRLSELTIGMGSVSMTFMLERLGGISIEYDPEPDSESDLDLEPSTSKQAKERELRRLQEKQQKRMSRRIIYEVNVVRRFDEEHRLDRINFQINANEWHDVTVEEFYKIFFVQPVYSADMLRQVHQHYANNWLKIIQADANSYINLRDTGNPFDTFVKLLDTQCDGRDQELLKKLASYCLAAQEKSRIVERRFLLHIFERVRSIFEYVTNNEYTVLFFVPRLNQYTGLDEVTLEDFDFGNVRTCIRLKRDDSEAFWHRVDHNIMDIMLVAFQLALASAGQQSVLFLGQLEKLSEFICLQYTTAAFMNGIHTTQIMTGSSTKWYCLRYLHRIIELAETLGLVVFIEYPGVMTLLPENRQVIKCMQKLDCKSEGVIWQLKEDFTEAATDIERLREAIDLN